MRVLIVHDRHEVAKEISGVLTGMGVAAELQKVAADYNSARQLLSSEHFDLLIIDLTLPLSEGHGAATYEYAGQLLDELFRRDTLNAPGDVIGITKDIDALQMIDSALGKHLMTTIPEDTDGKWRNLLEDKILYTKKSVLARALSANRHFDYDVLILTAMDEEFKPYNTEFDLQPMRHFDGAKEFLFFDKHRVERRGIAFSFGRSGQPVAASRTQALLAAFRPRLALMTGYCGGVKSKVKFGDLIFFESAYAWDYGKWEDEPGPPPVSRFASRPNPIGLDEEDQVHRICRSYIQADFNRQPDFLDKIREKSLGKLQSFDMLLKPVGSGSAVVANDAIVAQIRNLNDSIWGVDMESYGFYYASKSTAVVKPKFLCLKAVSDFCNGEKGDELHKVCSFISASVAVDLITTKYEF